MNLPLLFARRYLFAKRSTNAINIITAISVIGVAIGTAALILVLSVFNGFEALLTGLFGHFNPNIKITPAQGKTFIPDSLKLARLRALPGIAFVSETLEEIAFFEYEGSQDFGVLKGVDDFFAKVNRIDSTIREGRYQLQNDEQNLAILGAGVRNKLTVNVNDPLATLTVFMPTEQRGGVLDKPFKSRLLFPTGTFAIQQDFDNQYVLTNLAFAREILDVEEGTVSALEIRCSDSQNYAAVKKEIRQIIGEGFLIRDEYEQNEAFFKVMQLEKWMGFAITSLMLFLMAVNTIGALWMMVLDKQKDISMLKSMGATDRTVHRIFLLEGFLLTTLGMIIGMILAGLLYIAQKHYGLISIPEGFLVDSYPIEMRWSDFLPVVTTVMCIGLIAALLPAQKAVRVPAFLREE